MKVTIDQSDLTLWMVVFDNEGEFQMALRDEVIAELSKHAPAGTDFSFSCLWATLGPDGRRYMKVKVTYPPGFMALAEQKGSIP